MRVAYPESSMKADLCKRPLILLQNTEGEAFFEGQESGALVGEQTSNVCGSTERENSGKGVQS